MEPIDRLIEILCGEYGKAAPALAPEEKQNYFRSLCNVRPPKPATEEFLSLQDEYLSRLNAARGIADAASLCYKNGIAVWQGDITRLNADGIVNACNERLLGCFMPLHGCIDNAIHSFAGVQLRLDCNKIMQGKTERCGRVKVTSAYNLPCRYVFHTVGPQVFGRVTLQNKKDLKNCYLSCLDKAEEMGLGSLAFCCISTGVYGYPNGEACRLAVNTVKNWKGQRANSSANELKIIFNVFKDEDRILYERGLKNGR